MKRWIAAFLSCLLLSGCGNLTGGLHDTVTFYYVRSDYQADMSSPIGTEQREATGHRNDLRYFLAMYLMGPAQESLSSLLPSRTQILSLEERDSQLVIRLSNLDEVLSDSDYSLACACLTLTFLELSGLQGITVESGSRSITMNQDNIAYFDTVLQSTETEETS